MPRLSLSLLGPFQAALDGQPITNFKSNKVRALLAYLVTEADRPHPREALAGLLWPDYPDRTALNNLRFTLSSLRQSIDDRAAAPPFLSITRDTLQFNLASDYSLDLIGFEKPSSPEVIDHVEQTLARYRGQFLEAFSCDSAAFEEWLLFKRERISHQVLTMLRRLTLHYEQCGEYEHAAIYAWKQLELEPWDEEAYQELMRVLALSGQRSAALAQFEACRCILLQELGVEPSSRTVSLRDQIERELITAASQAHETLLTNVPTPLTLFVGRQREIADTRQLLINTESPVRLLTLTGAGGCGKTRLAIQIASDFAAANHFKHGVWWIDLARLSDPTLVLPAVASVFGLQDSTDTSLDSLLSNHLRTKETLMVFDNCEHLIDACARLIDQLLSACPHLQVLATSREPIGLTGEVVWRVPSLALPAADAEHLPPDRLLQYDAINLFVKRAAVISPHWEFAANASAVTRICARLDGLALAIELAAARLRVLSAEQIATRLDDRFQLLIDGSRTALPRHQTLRATMEWSYGFLSDQERRIFQRLSVFAGGWTLEAAEQVVSDDRSGSRRSDVLDRLTQLIDKSLVMVDKQSGEVRYRLLETIREYAREKLMAASEVEAMRDRHLEYFAQYAERIAPRLSGPQQKFWLNQIETDHDNLRAALKWSLDNGLAISGLRLAGALSEFWDLRGYLSEGRQWLKRILDMSPSAPSPARAKAIFQSGVLVLHQGAVSEANILAVESLALYRELGDQQGVADTLVLSGIVAHFSGNDEQAARLLHEALSAFRQIGDRFGYAYALLWIARGQMRRGENTQAAALLEVSLVGLREQGNNVNVSFALGSLGDLARHQGDFVRATALRKESLRLAWEVESKGEACYALEQLALIALAQGESTRAVKIWGATEVLRESLNRSMTRTYEAEHSLGVATARSQLGEERFAAVWAEGRTLTLEKTINYALENPESQSAPALDRLPDPAG